MRANQEARKGIMTAIHESIKEYLAAMAAEGKAPRTLEVYSTRLRRFVGWCYSQGKTKIETLSAADFRAYIAHLQTSSDGSGTPHQSAMVIKALFSD